jgi:hypothetical protein
VSRVSGLRPEQIDFYRDEGYLQLDELFDPKRGMDLLRAELDEIVNLGARAAHAEGLLSDLFEQEPFERRLASIAAALDEPSELLGRVGGKLRTPGMFAILTEPAILDVIESLIGPEILAHPQFNIRAKLPHQDRGVVPWHQDLAYLQPDAEETFMVNFWIPLVNATVENGCMEVMPRSHGTLVEHVENIGPGQNFRGVLDENLPPGEHVPCPVKVGGALLIQHKTLHRSTPNLSDHIRWSLDLRYSDPAWPTGRDGVPGFIARSAQDPSSVARSVEDWDRIMDGATAS